MSFLNPVLLGFSAAIAVPIIIHLLNRRRFRQVPWAAMRFLRISIEKNRRRMQWEDLLLLILRCLVVLLLALALARPALRAASGWLGSGRAAAVILVDRSASLGASDGTRTRFDLAHQAAEAVVDAYPTGSGLSVILAGDRAEPPAVELTYDLNLVRKTLREATLTDLATDHAVSIAQASELLATQTALRKEIVLITDRQAWGWRRLSDIAQALARSGRDTRLRVVQVGEPLEDNLAVSSLSRSAGFASAGEPLRFHAEIENHGVNPVRQIRATLHIDDGPAVDEAVADVLAPGETRRLTFFGRLPTPDYHSIEVRLSEDRLPADDRRTMVVRAAETVQVLVVDSDPDSNSAFFLRNALQPVPADLAPKYYLQPRILGPSQLAFARLSDFDAVILADVASMSVPAVDALVRYVHGGGALLVFPGPVVQPSFWNSELVERTGLFPARLGEVKGSPEADEGQFSLETGPYQHPLFALWNEAGAGSLLQARFRAVWELVPVVSSGADTNSASQVMIRYSDGSPAAVEASKGRGRVLLFSSTAGTRWNDFAIRPPFVPMLHRAVGSVAQRQEDHHNITVGSPISLAVPGEYSGHDLAVNAPGTPPRRMLRMVKSGQGGGVLDFTETTAAGMYRVGLQAEARTVAAFAAQIDPRESDLTELAPEQRRDMERLAQVIDWQPGQDLRAAFDRERMGVELWLPLAVGVLLLGTVESWLAQQFSRSK